MKDLLAEENYEWQSREPLFRSYTVSLLKCKNCSHVFRDGEKRHVCLSDRRIMVCDKCLPQLKKLIDFDVNGSKEPEPRSWAWMRRLALQRDHYQCRICGGYRNVEVHHITPKKAGGTHHLKNLITLCQEHHKETYKNDYAGLQITDYFIKEGTQMRLVGST